jgi:phage terminase small subunit
MNKPPKGLQKGGKTLWKQVLNGWEVPPEQYQVLENCCKSQDRIDTLQAQLKKEGMTVKNRFGVVIAHPSASLLRAEIANFGTLYRLLCLAAPSGEEPLGRGRQNGWSLEGD